jgi:hypothetical protein
MISRLIYSIAVVLLFASMTQAQQCYIDPFTGLQVCPKTNRPILNAIAERPLVKVAMPALFEDRGYSIASQSSSNSGGSFGSVVVKSYSSSGGSTGTVAASGGSTGTVSSGGSSGFSGVYSGGSTGSVSVVRSYSAPVPSVSFASCICPDCGCMKSSYSANNTASFASVLNASGSLFHDPSYSGAEVVYRSSGIATPSDAIRTWRRSGPHRRLIRSGAITEVICNGSVCVGR